MKAWLTRVGTAHGVGADCTVVFAGDRCAGCEGRCGLSVGDGDLPLATDLPEGTTVEAVVSVRGLANRALAVFGWPLGALVAAAALGEWSTLGEPLAAGVLVAAFLAAIGFRLAFAKADRAPRRLPAARDIVRVLVE